MHLKGKTTEMHQLIRLIMVFHFGYINTLNETSGAMNHIDLLLLISWELTSLRHPAEELISYFKMFRESNIKETMTEKNKEAVQNTI